MGVLPNHPFLVGIFYNKPTSYLGTPMTSHFPEKHHLNCQALEAAASVAGACPLRPNSLTKKLFSRILGTPL